MAVILVVDDRAINLEFLETLLGYVGHEVLRAADGAEALGLAFSKRPDLIISDVLMPVMGGVELADRIHENPSIAHIPIIFYTATYRVPEASVLARSCRVSAVLAKPAEPQAILDAVAAALGTGPAPLLMPEQAAAPPSFLGATLPSYLHDLSQLQHRLRRVLDEALEENRSQADGRRSDVIFSSYQTLSLRLAALLELGMVLASKRDPQELLDLFCTGAKDIMNSEYAIIAILDGNGRRLQNWATRGLDAETHAEMASIDPRGGIFGTAIITGNTHRDRDQSDVPTTLGLPYFHPFVTSVLVVPLPLRSTAAVCGWLCFSNRVGTDSFDAEDEQFSVTLAAQLALAYGNLIMYDEIQQHAAALEVEVVERRRAQNELAYRAAHDQTTGLPRFVLIEEYLENEFVDAAARGGRIVVLYVDIDRLHAVNETRGRLVGDFVLCAIAERLSAVVGHGGKIAHIASDEFAVAMVAGVHALDQTELAEVVRRRVEEPILHEGQRIYVTCSVGVSCFPENGANPQELLRQAEAAMLRAKREGRNIISTFSNEHKQALEDRLVLGSSLSDAVREGQLVLHYQPQISARESSILGFEALVRWQSPEFGFLLPGRFLDVAEDLGLIVDIGNFVVESVCRQTRAWLDAGATDFSVSINVSPLQLQRPDFVDRIGGALDEWQIPARHIELELTENMMADNVERVIGTMRALKALGVQLALDDFGTGYSSLNYLRRFPIDKLKIDQSFVRDIGSDAGAAGICRAIITLGHQLGMTVLAEGVETAAQAEYLRANDCDQFQGFYFGRPEPASQGLQMLRHRDSRSGG